MVHAVSLCVCVCVHVCLCWVSGGCVLGCQWGSEGYQWGSEGCQWACQGGEGCVSGCVIQGRRNRSGYSGFGRTNISSSNITFLTKT